ncbi:unnamed protein product [Nezara viridula]|uniref:Uncharacterized protein n=1 Tax=Nezara viridula TaxID=85310 RepID=A0A9P0HQB1_NEZVI|nr:unnamed protein product [Nezara viridula]
MRRFLNPPDCPGNYESSSRRRTGSTARLPRPRSTASTIEPYP